jgi:FkbM family methyltransferase
MYNVGQDCQLYGANEIYNAAFGPDKRDGVFVEVGAYDGLRWSHTIGLVEKNWRGLLVEPNPVTFKNLMNNLGYNTNLALVNCAIGAPGTLDLYLAHAISTTSKETAETYKECGWYSGNENKVTVPSVPLDALLREVHVPREFDLLSVDTEGTELQVLETFEISYWLPKLCVVEVSQQHETKGFGKQATSINEYFANAGYILIYSGEVNNVYLRGTK